MPTFTYIAKSSKGEVKSGELEGKDKRSVVESLRSEGFFVTTITEKEKKKEKELKLPMFTGVSLKDKMMFAMHLGIMLSSGLSLPKALEVIANQTKNRKFKRVLDDLGKDVKMGSSLADSLERHPVFDELSVNMIRVGELGGNIEEVLGLLANQLEKEHTLLSRVRGAMYYPTVIVMVMIVVGIAMMMYVVPKLTSIFADIQTTLPFSTRMVITVSDYMANHQWVVLSGVAILIVVFILFFKSSMGKK